MKLTQKLRTAFSYGRAWKWRQNHPNFLLVFNWHQVTPTFDPYIHHEHTWTALDLFERGIEYLSNEFCILPLNEAINHLNRGSLQGPCVSLTFDDGDVSNAEYVVPLLRRYNLPATFFINTAYLQGVSSYWYPILSYLRASIDPHLRSTLKPDLFEKAANLRETNDTKLYDEMRNYLESLAPLIPNLRSRLVSEEWLSSLDGEQFSIGAHGHEHQRFSMMSATWQRDNLERNVQILSQFRAFRPIFALPFGRPWDWTKETIFIAHDLNLHVVLANGGVNIGAREAYLRIPSDSQRMQSVVRTTLAI